MIFSCSIFGVIVSKIIMDNVYPYVSLHYFLNFLVGVGRTNSQHYLLVVVREGENWH